MRTSLVLLVSVVMTKAFALDLELVQRRDLPFAEKYVIFRSAVDPTSYYFLPMVIAVETDKNNEPRFGVQMSGYGRPDPSGRAASVTLTYKQVADSHELDAIRTALMIPPAKLSPLPSVSYEVRLVTANQRSKGLEFDVLGSGATTAGTTGSVNFDLSTLESESLSDFFTRNADRGGLLFSFSVANVRSTADQVAVDASQLSSALAAISPWPAARGIEELSTELARRLQVDGGFRGAFVLWLQGVVAPIDLYAFPNGFVYPGWDLTGASVKKAVADLPGSLKLTGAAPPGKRVFYTAFLLEGFCNKYPSHFLDLTTGQVGCETIHARAKNKK